MTALAASTDVEAVLGRTLTSEESSRVEAALEKASEVVRDLTGRKYEAGSHTVRRKVRSGRVTLDDPDTVTDVVFVDECGNDYEVTSWTLRGDTVYGVGGYKWIEVTYTSDGNVPDAVVEVTASIVARALTSDTPEGAQSWTVTRGPFSETAAFGAGVSDSLEPTPSEKAILRRYALRRTGLIDLV